ncbi:hypothetical protein R3P38DRAFT_2781569 [Favolaschia claudopus]|uniref:Uncharacterized protein n=1 Tax=Favolaschia claudopus TaxID=2862362 RepID=A0AAV9ZWN6_9AGAR
MLARAFSGVLRERRVGVFSGPDGSIKNHQPSLRAFVDVLCIENLKFKHPTHYRDFAQSHREPPGGSHGMRCGAATAYGGSFGGWKNNLKNLTREKSLKSSRGSRLPVLSSDDPRQGLAGCREPLESL